jgi:undecaprenyl-diphosphatase
VNSSRQWRLKLPTLVGAALFVALVSGFIALASEVVEKEFQSLDETGVRSFREPSNPAQPVGPSWLPETARDVTAMGSVFVLSVVTVLVTASFLLDRKAPQALAVGLAGGGGVVVSLLLKHAVQRPRPSVVPQLTEVLTSSFPSGHSMMSAAVYVTLAAVAAQFASRKSQRVFLIAAACFVSFLVGLSRIYLGVHYPTDVLAGWMAGGAWAILCTFSVRLLKREGKLPPADSPLP